MIATRLLLEFSVAGLPAESNSSMTVGRRQPTDPIHAIGERSGTFQQALNDLVRRGDSREAAAGSATDPGSPRHRTAIKPSNSGRYRHGKQVRQWIEGTDPHSVAEPNGPSHLSTPATAHPARPLRSPCCRGMTAPWESPGFRPGRNRAGDRPVGFADGENASLPPMRTFYPRWPSSIRVPRPTPRGIPQFSGRFRCRESVVVAPIIKVWERNDPR